MSTHVFMFKPEFIALIFSGTKHTTIRPRRKRAVRLGDAMDMRVWEGKPYRARSHRRKFGQAEVQKVEIVTIHKDCVMTASGALWADHGECEDFARADGFGSFTEMRAWFAQAHGLPFTGDLYDWGATIQTLPAASSASSA